MSLFMIENGGPRRQRGECGKW